MNRALATAVMAGALSLAGNAAPFLASPAHAQGIGDEFGLSPYLDWKTLESEHFRVTFPAELEDIARKAAVHLEEAHRLLTPHLKWTPRGRTQVYVIDNADQANGMASPLQRLGILLYATPPDPWFSTAYYDDWLRLLAIHEYTHYVNMDTTIGLYDLARYVFKDVLLPNSAWPSWMIEGLAVYMETRYSKGGRGRSPYYEMVLRSAVENKALGKERHVPLDRINGDSPFYPGGEIPYLFGYQLMNQVARQKFNGMTADNRDPVRDGDDALGLISLRSGARVPYFINGNVENITGKDWYRHWADFIVQTRERMDRDLKRIKSQPLTKMKRLTHRSYSAFGASVSPDKRWLAYTMDSLDRQRGGLYFRDLKSGEERRITDKARGISVAFSPDSKTAFFSTLDRKNLYGIFSDLAAYDAEKDRVYFLSDGLRARDPDVSPDGKRIAFTLSAQGRTGVGIAALEKNESGRYELGEVTRVYWPKGFDRAAHPKFSRDGNSLVFSLHINGKNGQDLIALDLETRAQKLLVSDGKHNRFPAFDESGRLYFVSDRSGVDNIFRYSANGDHAQVTNVTTGIWYPAFGSGEEVFASVFSMDGWDIASIRLSDSPIDTNAVTVSPPPAPAPHPGAADGDDGSRYQVKDYSIFPSIWPRGWAPFVTGGNHWNIGGAILGFDTLNYHQYLGYAYFDTATRNGNWSATYWNRSFGPTLQLSASEVSNEWTFDGGGLLSYSRKSDYAATLSYPFVWTFSSLTPSIGFSTERERYFLPGVSDRSVGNSGFIPTAHFSIGFADTESSRLGVTTERGRITKAGVKWYGGSADSYKLLLIDREHLPITAHSVLVPAVKAVWTTRTSLTFSEANAVVRVKSSTLGILPSDAFDERSLRGYPDRAYASRSAVVGSLDYRFPIWRIYRGLGTDPVYLEHLSGLVFGETAWFPSSASKVTLPAAGGGIELAMTLFVRIPLNVSLQYHHGFNRSRGGVGELFTALNLGQLPF